MGVLVLPVGRPTGMQEGKVLKIAIFSIIHVHMLGWWLAKDS